MLLLMTMMTEANDNDIENESDDNTNCADYVMWIMLNMMM